MSKKYHQLAAAAGWVSALLFVLGVLGGLTGSRIVISGNDYWQAAMYLVLFAVFAALKARE